MIEKAGNNSVRTGGKLESGAAAAGKKRVQLPKDEVQIEGKNAEGEKEKRPLSSKLARKARKAVSTVTGLANASLSSVTGIAKGVTVGINKSLHPEKDIATLKKDLARFSIMGRAAVFAAAGSLLFGPIGLVLGGAGGYISGAISNYLDNRSKVSDSFIENVGSAINKQIDKLPKKEESTSFRKALNAAVIGGKEGARQGWKTGKIIGEGTGAGLISGAKFIAADVRETLKNARDVRELNKKLPPYKNQPHKESNLAGKAFRIAMGALCAASGVIMNVPGGMVEGSLEAVEISSNRKELTRPLLLFSTNAGKVVPPAVIGAALGGPVGAAAGTAAGIVTASLTTIIDGKYGFNRRIVNRVDRAIGEVIEDPGEGEGYAVYHNAAKGTLVGAYAGLKEGMLLGYKGGAEFADGLFEAPDEAVRHEEESDKSSKSPSNQNR